MRFRADLNRAVSRLQEQSEEAVRGTLFQLFSNVIRRTPVGNPSIWKSGPRRGYIGGTLRNSWYCTIGSPSSARVRGPNSAGQDSIQSLSALTSMDFGETVYLTNNAPYAQRVEFGWSRQAPAGMVRISLAELNRVI